MIKKISIISLILLLICALLASSFAWFTLFADVEFPPSSATAEASAYFESGDGSADDPYVLSDKIHVYNLAWLQYIGYFNGADVSNGLEQSYFVLKNDIDMEGMTIPPIGTTQYPFIGSFDGQGYVISNLNTANAEIAFTLKPGTAEFEAANALLSRYNGTTTDEVGNVMGFFGVVGSYTGEAADSTVDTSIIAVKNFGLTNYTLTSSSQTTTVGFVAGYVNAPVENVIVGSCKLNTPNATEGKENADFTSEYALIGYSTAPENLTENSVTLYDPTITTETLGAGSGGEGGGGVEGFGGSMDMTELIRRLTYMLGENVMRDPPGAVTIPDNYRSSLDKYPVNFSSAYYESSALQSVLNYSINDSSKNNYRIGYLGEGSVIPLNVDTTKMFGTQNITVSATGTRANTTYLTTDYYHINTKEDILPSNTGYIVSDGSAGAAWIRARIQTINGAQGGISNSLTDNSTRITYTEYDDGTYTTNLSLYTVDINGTNSVINAKSNYFKQYSDVVKRFSKTQANLYSKENDVAMISGIRFWSGTSAGVSVSSDGTVTSKTTGVKNFTIHGVPNDPNNSDETYEMINGAINFTLNGAGYITAIAGTYASSSDHALFTLYQVERDSDHQITTATKIETVHVKTDTGTLAGSVTEIKYNLTDTTGYLCVFDSSTMNSLTTSGAAYYFEIPVLAGDYALGGPKIESGSYNGAYLMYLDIGSNGSIGLGGSTNPTTVISEYIEESQNTYEYVSGVTVAETDADGNITNNTPMGSVALQIAGNNQNEITVSRTGNAVSVSGGNLTMLGAGLTSAENAIPAPTSSTTAVIRRRRYIHSDGAEVIVTRTGEDDLTVTVTAKDSSGNDIEITENTTTGGVTTIKTAQRTYTITWADISKPNTAILIYQYAPASGVTVTNDPVFNLAENNTTTGSYTVTVSATAATKLTVKTVEFISDGTVTSATINGTTAAVGTEIDVPATQAP